MAEPSAASAPARVFLAEDNEDLASLVARRFKATPGWSLTHAATFDEAAGRLRGDRFDLVVLDYKLPDGDGLGLLRIVREVSPETPVLFLTAHGSEDVAMQALSMGATDYMQKSGDMLEELPARIRELLSHADDQRAAARVRSIELHADHLPSQRRPAPAPKRPAAHDRTEEDPGARYAAIVAAVVGGDVLGAAIFDGSGKPIAHDLPDDLDAAMVGTTAFQIHAQVGVAGRVTGLTPRAYEFILEVDGAVLATTTVGGSAIVAILLESRAGRDSAAKCLHDLASRVRE